MKTTTLTLKQLSVLRMILRLQKIRFVRRALEFHKAGHMSVSAAVVYAIGREDRVNGIDVNLMIAEHKAVSSQVQAGSLDAYLNTGVSVDVWFDEDQHEFCLTLLGSPLGMEPSLGAPEEQIAVLQIIESEREGILLALQTARSEIQAPQLVQPQPRGLRGRIYYGRTVPEGGLLFFRTESNDLDPGEDT